MLWTVTLTYDWGEMKWGGTATGPQAAADPIEAVANAVAWAKSKNSLAKGDIPYRADAEAVIR